MIDREKLAEEETIIAAKIKASEDILEIVKTIQRMEHYEGDFISVEDTLAAIESKIAELRTAKTLVGGF